MNSEKKVCLVPHGWGQEITGVKSIFNNKARNKFNIQVNDNTYTYDIKSKSRIDCEEKHIRSFESGEEFLRIGSKVINGRIIKKLIPVFEYSKNTTSENNK